MATKPVTGNPNIWAPDVNYPAGADPWSGLVTKVTAPTETSIGFDPETGITAEYSNAFYNQTSEWTRWVSFGSITADENAHIVEADANGKASLALLEVAPTTPGNVAVSVIGTLNDNAMVVTSSGTGDAGIFSATGTANGLQGSNVFGTGHGVLGTTTDATNFGGSFINVGTNGTGVSGVGDGTGSGGIFTGGTTGAGITANGGATSGPGVLALTSSTSPAVRGTSAITGGAGVEGQAFGNAVGLQSIAVDGYGVVAESDQSNPTRSAARIVPQDKDPGTALSGDYYYTDELAVTSGLAFDELRIRSRGGWRSVATRTDGYVKNFITNAATVVSGATAGIFVPVVTLTLAAPNEPRRVGDMEIQITGNIGVNTGTPAGVRIRVVDVTATVDILDRTLELFHGVPASGFESTFAITFRYTLPLDGARAFRIDISPDAAGNVQIRDASIIAEGVF